MVDTVRIEGRDIVLGGDPGSDWLIVQPVMPFDLRTLGAQMGMVTGPRFAYMAPVLEDWNADLSPWAAPAAFGKEDFGDGAGRTLSFLLDSAIPEAMRRLDIGDGARLVIGGYSLAGLFSLWAAYTTDRFYGVAAASPSVWFSGWDGFIEGRRIMASRVHLSLGDGERTSRRGAMGDVVERMGRQHSSLVAQLGDAGCTMEWNPGNHFRDVDVRKAKAFSNVIGRYGRGTILPPHPSPPRPRPRTRAWGCGACGSL